MSNTLKILDREYLFEPTPSGLNYVIAESFKEIFIDVFEINCGDKKIIAEKVDSINGDPVIKIDTELNNKIYSTLYVLKEGNHNIVLNVNSLTNGRNVVIAEKNIIDNIFNELYEPSITTINNEKTAAIEALHESYLDKKHKVEQFRQSISNLIDERISQINETTTSNVNKAKENLLHIIEKSLDENRIDRDTTLTEINSIRENILNTVELYTNSINQTAEEKTNQLQNLQERVTFEVDTKLIELDVETKSQLRYISEAYDNIKLFIDNVKEEFLNEKTSNIATVEKLFESVKQVIKDNIKQTENIVGKKLAKLQSIGDKKINDISTLIENKVLYFDEKAQALQSSVDNFNECLAENIQQAINQITIESEDKLLSLNQTKDDIDDAVQKTINELGDLKTQFTESINKKIKDIKSVAINKEDLAQLKKQIDSRFETESANIKKYIAAYGGGGGNSNAGGNSGVNQTLTFNEVTADLSISNGNTISLSALSGGGSAVFGEYLPLSGGTVTGSITVTDTLSTTTLYATSAFMTVIDITHYELSGFNVIGDVTIDGSLSASQIIYAFEGNSNQWNLTYSTVQSNSSNWSSVYSSFNTQSADNASVYSTVLANSATNWNYQGSDIKALSSNWQNTYTTVLCNSAAWATSTSSGEYLPLSGGTLTGDLEIQAAITAVDSIQFNLTSDVSSLPGLLTWNAEESTLNLGVNNDVTLQLGQETLIQVKNTSGEVIYNGAPVYASGASGGGSGNITVSAYRAGANDVDELYFLGVATQELADNDFGFITTFGKVRDVVVSQVQATDDVGALSAWPIGTILYPSATQTGKFTSTPPKAPNKDLPVAMVISENGNQRSFFIRAETGYHLDELHDVARIAPQNDNVLTFSTLSGVWYPKAPETNYLPLTGGTLTGTLSTNEDVEITDSTKGIILTSPSNYKYRVTVTDAGELVTTLI